MVKIYESPDGGKTVFERDTDSGERICIENLYFQHGTLQNMSFMKYKNQPKMGIKPCKIY